MNIYVLTLLKGLAMGAADVVPGVSGGTIAFITGIYERLLNAIRSISPKAVVILKNKGFAEAWRHIDGTFLLSLFSGILISIFSLARLLEWTLVHYPQLLWGFFFGLIISSAVYVGRQVGQWSFKTILALLVGTAIAFSITLISPAEASTEYWMVFLAGSIAICAMILPGISGSFILLLMGMYAHVLTAINDRNFVFLLIFGSGCAIGLLSFSHVLSWTFRHFRDITLATLTGFMVGSLNKVWPWQNVASTITDRHGMEVPFQMKSVLPGSYTEDSYLLWVILLMLVGFGVVLLIEWLGKDNPKQI